MNAPDFHVHSGFSILDGMGSPLDIVKRAKELGWGAVGLTEHGWMGSAPAFYLAARENKIKPIIGCELYVVPDEILGVNNKDTRSSSYHLTVLALSAEGYQNLVAWTTFAAQRENYYYNPRISLAMMAEVAPHPLHHNVVLSGCMGGELCSCISQANGNHLAIGASYISSVKSLFPNFYVELQNHSRPKLMDRGYDGWEKMVEQESEVRAKLISLANETGTPVVLTNDSHFQSTEQRTAHLMMTAQKRGGRGGWAANYLPEYGYFCVTPQTRVLKKNLKWVEAGDLNVGDTLWAFDENNIEGQSGTAGTRQWRESTVLNTDRKVLPCWKVVLDNGDEIIVSETHPWLVRKYPSAVPVEWRETRNLKPGNVVPHYLDTWNSIRTWDAGWLAGIADGEGCVSSQRQLSVFQKEGSVLNRVRRLLDKFDFRYTEDTRDNGKQVLLRGGFQETARFLGSLRPVRLIENFNKTIEGATLRAIENCRVVSCTPCGEMEVVTLETSTHTFFAEGYGAHNTNYLQSMEKIADRTPELPSDALENALAIAEEADIRLAPLDDFRYSIPTSGYKSPVEKMRKRSAKRVKELKKKHGVSAVDRFEMELEAMGEFGDYLMLMSDFIRKAKKQGILTNTRGSAANSLLCYCLGIHDIDSVEYGLLFSRFFNPGRKKLPDIDIDIDADRYEDFMRIVHEHMEPLVGHGQVRQISNYGTLANRSTFRMIAEKLGMEKEQIDEVAKLLPQMIDSGMVDEENDAYELLKEEYPEIYEMAAGVFDQIKNISQHACAWVFGTDERRLDDWIPLTLISSSGVSVTAYNMKLIEEFGLVKGDFLRLKTLSVVQRTRQMIGQDTLDITDIPLDDPKTFKLLRDGRTEGVFTLQGKENRRGVMEVEAESVQDVIRAVAIYRPALTREGRHTLFNERRKGEAEVVYPHEIAKVATADTFGVPVFQEQAMELGYGIGMSDVEVDEIYKAIKLAKGVGRGAKEAFTAIEPKFRARAKKLKLTKEETDALWEMLQAFQGYGFNKGHATSYGILGVRSAYLKAHYPAEFFTSLLAVYPQKAKYVAAARAEGFQFDPPSVNISGSGFTLDRTSGAIRVGLAKVKGLGPVAIKEIVAGQPFSSLDDFKHRTSRRALNKTRIETLAAVGAFEDFGVAKTADDAEEFQTLGFTIKKPRALKGIKPKHVAPRESQRGWRHLGRERGAELTEGRASVSKLFWIPPIEDSRHYKGLEKKASAWAQVESWLLTVVDENGLPFHVMVNDDKEAESRILQVLSNRFRGGVICLDGAIRQPFATDGPLGFRFYGITGADFQQDPQMWMDGEQVSGKFALGIIGLHEIKRAQRRSAA